MTYRPKWQIALELLDRAVGRGIHFEWLTFDEGTEASPVFLRGWPRCTSSSSARSPAISPVGSRLPAWSHDRSIARDVGAGVRFRGWLPTVPTLDVSTRCSAGANSGTNPGAVGRPAGRDLPGIELPHLCDMIRACSHSCRSGQFTVSRCPVWRRVHRPAMRFGEVPPRCWLRPWSAASRSSRFGRQPSLQDRNACGSGSRPRPL